MRNINAWRRFVPSFSWLFFVAIVALNFYVSPYIAKLAVMAGMVGVALPLMLGAMAATPSILSGRGGIDLSIGPLMGLVNIVIVASFTAGWQVSAPIIVIAVLILGAAVGALNGVLVSILRLQPIVATLGTFLILGGVNLWLMPIPTGPSPEWVGIFARSHFGMPGGLMLLGVAAAVWLLLLATPFVTTLLAVGGDDRVALTVGISVTKVRVLAYALGGFFAALAGIALTGLIGSADASVGSPFTLQVITAVALGGISLGGGKGSMFASIRGALSLFLIQNLLTNLGVSIFWQQVCFGATLLMSLMLSSPILIRRTGV